MIESLIKETKQITKRPKIGEFSIDGPELDWIKCREDFSIKFNERSKGIFFSCDKEKQQKVASFINKTENILNISLNIDYTKFYYTNLNFAFWIEPSYFWKNCPMKRSFFTILLRSGLDYNGLNYEDCLYNKEMISTKNAIQRFLFGFTEFKEDPGVILEGVGKGWVSYFANKNIEFVRSKLKSSFFTREFLFGEKILWTN